MKRSRARSPEAIEFARAERATTNEFASTVWQWVRNRRISHQKFRRPRPCLSPRPPNIRFSPSRVAEATFILQAQPAHSLPGVYLSLPAVAGRGRGRAAGVQSACRLPARSFSPRLGPAACPTSTRSLPTVYPPRRVARGASRAVPFPFGLRCDSVSSVIFVFAACPAAAGG